MPHWKAGKTDDQVLDDLKETQKQAAGDFAKDQAQSKGVKENKKSALVIENDFTPVEYDPQYILMVNHLKKYFPIKGGMVSKTVGWVKAVDDYRPYHSAPVRRQDRRSGPLQRPGDLRSVPQRNARHAHQDADYLSGPVFLPVSPVACGRDHRRGGAGARFSAQGSI